MLVCAGHTAPRQGASVRLPHLIAVLTHHEIGTARAVATVRSTLRSVCSGADRIFGYRRLIVGQPLVVQTGSIGRGARASILHRTLVNVSVA